MVQIAAVRSIHAVRQRKTGVLSLALGGWSRLLQSDPSMRYDKGRQACSHWPWEDGPDCCSQIHPCGTTKEDRRALTGPGRMVQIAAVRSIHAVRQRKTGVLSLALGGWSRL